MFACLGANLKASNEFMIRKQLFSYSSGKKVICLKASYVIQVVSKSIIRFVMFILKKLIRIKYPSLFLLKVNSKLVIQKIFFTGERRTIGTPFPVKHHRKL